MSTPRKYRQGDIFFQEIATIPEGLKPVPLDQGRVIVAYGEVTGHAHAVQGDVQFLAADIAELERAFLTVEGEFAQVVHEEHDTITLPPGNYIVKRQREYAPEAPVWVAD